MGQYDFFYFNAYSKRKEKLILVKYFRLLHSILIVLLHLLVTIYIVYILDMTSHQMCACCRQKNIKKIQEPNLLKPNLS